MKYSPLNLLSLQVALGILSNFKRTKKLSFPKEYVKNQ